MSLLTAGEMQQERLWGETQSLGLQGLHVHLGGEAGMFHHGEPLIPGQMKVRRDPLTRVTSGSNITARERATYFLVEMIRRSLKR